MVAIASGLDGGHPPFHEDYFPKEREVSPICHLERKCHERFHNAIEVGVVFTKYSGIQTPYDKRLSLRLQT